MPQRKWLRNNVCVLMILALCAGSWAADKGTAARADRVVIVKSTRTLTLLNHGQINNQVSISSPCVLVSGPSSTAAKESSLPATSQARKRAPIYGETAVRLLALLHMGSVLVQDTKFQDALLKYGLSPSPIKATLLGRFQYARFSGVKTFDAEKVLELKINPPEAQPGPNIGKASNQ
jgi:hypothetical protein